MASPSSAPAALVEGAEPVPATVDTASARVMASIPPLQVETPRREAPRRSATATLLSVSLVGTLLGAMLAGSALGVMEADNAPNPFMIPAPRAAATGPAESPPGAVAAALSGLLPGPATPPAAAAATAPGVVGTGQEANPETAGDGVMDDLDEPAPAAPSPAPSPARPSSTAMAAMAAAAITAPVAAAAAAATPPAAAAAAPPNGATGRSRVVNSDAVPEGPALGYVEGHPNRITVTRIDNKPVEVHTASAYRRMYDAALHDGVRLRIVSGFRTMEHQQALYRAYRRGQGNLAALPGHSNHQSGHAVDLNTSTPGVLRWLDRNGRRFGFRRTVPTEAWHWEWW